MRLNKRDIDIITLVNRFGLVKKSDLNEAVNTTEGPIHRENSCIKRMRKLENEKILKSVGQAYGLGIKGKEILLNKDIEINYNRTPLGNKAIKLYKDNGIILKLNFLDSKSRIETIQDFKQNFEEINTIRLFIGSIILNGEKYLVYNIKDCTAAYLSNLILDTKKYNIDRVLLVVNNFDNIISIKNKLLRKGLKNIKVITNNKESFELLKMYSENVFNETNIIEFLKYKKQNVEIDSNKLFWNGINTYIYTILDLVEESADVTRKSLTEWNNTDTIVLVGSKLYKEYIKNYNDIKIKNKKNIQINFDNFKSFIRNNTGNNQDLLKKIIDLKEKEIFTEEEFELLKQKLKED